MESLEYLVPFTLTVSATVITLSFLLLGVNALLNAKIDPLKANQARFDNELKEIKAGQAEIKSQLNQLIAALKEKKVI